MKALSNRYGFLTSLLFLCVLNEVRCVPLDYDLSFPSNAKQTIPIDFNQDYNYVTEDILKNIENHFDESEIGFHSSEDAVDVGNEFKNQTFAQNEIFKNDTSFKSYQLTNDQLNQIQTINATNYLSQVNDTSQTKQSLLHKQGKTKDTKDYYKDEKRYKNVRLQTSDDRIEQSETDQALRREEILANLSSTGDLKYEARNDSDSEHKEISSHYAKSGHRVKDGTAQQEKNFQGANFTRTKTIHQANDRRINSEREQLIKSGSEDYFKEESSGLETLQKKCLNHLRQENQYKDQDKEIRRMRKQKNRKRTFFKRMGDNGPKTSWPNWDDFPEDCKDLLEEEINIQSASFREEQRKETGRSFDNDINVENSTKDGFTTPTPTPSPQENESQTQKSNTKRNSFNVNLAETTTTGNESQFNPPTEKPNGSFEDSSDTSQEGLNMLRAKFNLIQRYISNEDCDDDKYGFSKRLKPMGPTETKSNFTSLSRRTNADPEVIFQNKNITNQTIECVEGEMNCTQDYYEYYYIEQNVYGDNDYPEEEEEEKDLFDEFPIPSISTRQYKGTNTMKKKATHKKQAANLKANSILNESKSS